MLIIAPSWPQTGVACGAAASHSLSAPHSSISKWLHPIQRSCAGSISFRNRVADQRKHAAHAGVKQQRLVVFDRGSD